MKLRNLVVTLVCGLCLTLSHAIAQTVTGSLECRVVDQADAVVPGAVFIIRTPETCPPRSPHTFRAAEIIS